MRKYSTLGCYAQRMLCALFFAALVFVSNNVFSQGCPSSCGASPWGESYGVQYPIANAAQSLTVGSGTYTVFSTYAGGTYTFSSCGGSWADSYITGFPIGSSACLFYNDDNGPACTGTKASVNYSPTLDNLVNVQINRKVSGSCQGWVSGGTSGLLTYRCAPPSTPATTTFGNSQWNVYVWNAGDASGVNAWGGDATSYSGYLTDAALSFNSANHWASANSPSDAPSYLGCYVSPDNHSWAAKRTNFTCGIYTISIPTHDDACQLYVNGGLVLNHVACCDAHPNVWTGLLTSTSTVEFRVSEGGGGSAGEITITPVSTGTLTAGTVGSSQNICTGGDPSAFTSNSLPTGGAGPTYTGGSYTYDWGYQDNCTGAGVSGLGSGTTYDAPAGLTVTRCYYRRVIDGCGNDVITSPITVTVVADPTPATPTLTNSNICVGGSSSANVTYTGGVGSPSYSWEYFNGSTWNAVAAGTPAGASYSGASTATLSISGITAVGSHQYRAQVGASGSGCGTAASAGVVLTVVADPTISAPVVGTPTICTGGSSTVSSTASGGIGTVTYQWEYDNGGTWVPVANGLPTGAVYTNATTNTLTVTAITVPGVYNYRNTATLTGNGCNSATSSTGTVTVVADPSAATPVFTNSSICTTGSTQVSSATAGGTGSLGYQWQYFNGSTWNNVVNGTPTGATYTNATTNNMTIAGITPLGSYQYRLIFTASGSDCNTATSVGATLTVAAGPSVTTPAFTNTTICVGGASTASVTATGGTGTTSYAWEYFNGGSWGAVTNNTPAGATYTGASTASLDVSGITAVGGHQYRVIVTSSGAGCTPTTSTASTLTVVADPSLSAPTITNTIICSGGSTLVSSTASGGTGSFTYQWEYDNGGSWGAVANGLPTGAVYVNATTPSMSISGVSALGIHSYRLVLTASGSGCNSATSSTVSVAVVGDPSVSIPTFNNPTICVGGTSNVTASALNGTGTVSYQWQYFNGSTWNNVVNGTPAGSTYTNATSATMTVAGIATAGSYQYQVIVSATGSGCDPVTSSAATLTVNPDPAISISGAQTFCVSGSATLTATPSGGAVSNTIQWESSTDNISFNPISGANSTTYTATGVTSTTYFRATYSSTGNGCGTATSNVVIITIQPAIANNTIDPYQKFCLNGDPVVINGGAVTGGNGSYTYAWEQSTNGGVTWTAATGTNNQATYDPPFTSSSIRYRRIVTSGVCSSTSNEALILVLPLPQVTNVTANNVLCFGTSTGSISVNGSTANGSVYYSINGGSTYQVSGNFPGLPIGSYNVYVRDDSSCTNSYVGNSVVLTQPTDVTHTAVATDASCSGVFDGQISITATGGVTPYSYSLNGGPTQSGSNFLGLASGTYLISVFDANGCVDTSSVTINNSYAVSGSIVSQTNVSCFGGSNGAVTVQLSGGISPYVYSLNGGAFGAASTFTGLPANLYVVTLRDSKGCTDFLSVSITQPAQLAVTIDVVNNVLCNGDTTGEIFITVNGGTPGYTYNWSNGRTTEDNLNVGVGTYLLTVTDSKGCTTNASASVSQPLPLTIAVAQVQNLRCYNDNSGRIDISVNGGVPPYAYVWSNGASTEDIINQPAGTYTVSVYDGNGCMKTTTVAITQPAQLTTTISGNTVACNGGSTGIVDLTVFGGSPSYTYLWSNGYTSQDLTGVPAGIYNVIVTDANNCTTSNSYNVAQPGSLTLSTSITNVNCYGDSTGSIALSVSGGVLPYTYNWTNGATTQSLVSIPAGNYTVSVTDGNGCTVTAGATVTQPNQGLATAMLETNVTCSGANNGSANLTVSGGTLPYNYSWSNGATTEDLSNVGPNTYYVTVTDFKGCSIRDTAVITQPAPLVATIASTNVSCFGGNNGAADLTVTGGTAPYTFAWSPFATSEDLTNIPAGNYSVVVTDAKNCQAVAGVTISQPAQLALSAVTGNVTCNGAANGTINLTVTGGAIPYSYSWNSGTYTTEDLSGLAPGTYSVVVTDGNSCTASATYTITQPTLLNVTGIPTNVTCNGAANGAVNVTVSGGVSPYTFNWSNGATSEDVSALSGGIYDLTVTDANGCTFTSNFVITEPAALATSIVGTNVTCRGASNGAADLTVTGGTTPYSYLWSNFQNTQDLNNVSGGNYYVIVTDANGCTKRDSIVIFEPTQLVLSTAVANVLCNGNTTGAINLNVSGSVPGYTFAWSNGATTEDLTGLAAGTYTVTVTDANLCTTTASATVTQPAQPLSATLVPTDVTCNGAANGSVNLTATGGTTAYAFAWSNGATTEDLSNLGPNTYTVTITDANGCTFTNSAVVNEPAVLSGTIATINVSCYGGNNGLADLTVTGGNPGYTYLWSNFATTQDLVGVAAGNYSVIVTDTKGCQYITSTTITQPAQIVITANVTNISCNGSGTGAIDITLTGGTGAFTYAWSNGATTEDLTNLGPGVYTVTATDANLCTATASYTITQPLPLASTGVVTNVSCNGGNNGAINFTVNGGSAPFTFVWSNGSITEDISGLTAATYDVTATDANGCTATNSFVVTEPTAITSSIAGTNVTCYGASNGAADLTVSGGVTPYTFLWSTFQNTEDLVNLHGGTYYVIVTDANGCTKRDSIIITEPAQLVLTSVETNVLCNGAATGAVNLTVTGGTGAYTFVWSNGATTEDLSGLAAGTYTVTVTDGNGCTATRTVTLTQPAALVMNATTTNVACNGGGNGSVDITVNGGVFPYTFAWSNGATTEDVNGLSGGPVSVTVTDANGCTITQSFNITEPAAILTSVTGTNVTCFGASNGAANLTVSGGVAPYTYLWNNFQSTEDLNNIGGGTYYVIVTDANGCTKRDSVVITEPAQLVLTSVETNVLCNGAATGAVNLTVTGGTGAYTFVWSNGATTEDLSGLAAGTYTVTVTDGNGCTTTRTVTLTQPAALVMNATTTNVACNGGGNGSVDITVNGGVFPYTFAWSNGATTEDVNGLSGGPVSVTVTDANGCTITQSFNITEPTAITSSVVGTNVTCYGASNGAANLTVSGGVAPYTYLWNNFQATEDLNNIGGGTYYVIVTDANGCTKRDSVVITEPAALVLTSINTNVLCNGATTGAIDLTVTGGTGTYTFVWTTGATTEDVSGLAAGTYAVQVTDANGCADTLTTTITQPTAMVMNATTINVACNGGGNGSVDITVNGGVFPYTFAWSNGATTEDVNGLSGGTYSVTVSDANGCTLTQSFNISEPNALFSVLVGTNVTCYGASNGSADLAVGGGTPPYTYLWNNFHSTEDLFNISGGTYFVIITDANGCTKRDSIVITEPAQLVLTSVETNVLCNGAATGAVNLTVTGGTGAYTFAWSNGATTEDLSGLAAGTYTVTVTDGNGCTATRTVTLTQPAALVMNATTTNVACNGGGNGSVDITVNGGVFPYTFAWSNGATTEDVNGLSGGPVSVTVTDANGCTITQSYNITEPTAITSSVVGTNVTCYGANNGAANLTVSGGVAPYTYLWNTFQATEDLNNIGGGIYYVIVTDANGCTKRDSVIVTEPTQLVLATQVTNVLCNGNATGAIDLTPSGATPTYTFAWSNGATTEDISGLVVGTYTVTVTDANGCTATASATVTSPTALVVTGVVHNVFCAGGNDGNINLSVTGGAQPYTFAWSNGAVTEDLLNLTQGTYIVTVTDQNACTATATFNVTEPTGITSSIVGSNVACQGANNGSANLTVGGGTPPYTFFWSNFQNTEDISGLDGGIYYVIITDANGCTRRDSVIISEPTPIILTYTSSNVSCFNANDGSIDLTVNGGIPNYTFVWSNGATTEDISNLAGNTYSVTVTDANGCTATTSVLIINPSPLSANFITHNPSCYFGSDGSIDLLPTGGTPNFTFAWSTGATTEDITGLSNGLYIVTITDSKGCVLVDSVNIVEPAPLVTSGFITHVSCHGNLDGFIDITAYGGTLPYIYSWSTGSSTEDIGGLSGGNYTITTTDFNNCTVASLYVVNEPAQLTLGLTGTNVSCFGGTDGTAATLPGGGIVPYTYLWDDFATDSARTGLTVGKHALLLTDSNGCTVVDSIILTQPTDITILGTTTNVSCASGTDGAIDVTVGGGTPTYTYVWSNTATTEDISGIQAGNYAVQVTDGNGCVKAASFTLTQPKAINTQLLTDQPSCYSSKNGSASVIASEGVAPYSFVWSTTPAQSGNTATFLGADTYSVTVTDANSCSVSASVNIVEPDSIAVSTTAQASRCFNTATGAVFADVTGGEAPYIYSLNGVTQLGDTFVGLSPGNYILEVTDLNGCSGTSIFTIAEASQISVDLVSSENTLLTGMQTQLVANTTSSTPVIAYFWNPDSVVNFNDCSDPANCSTPYAAPLATTLYTVTVMNADSCTASDTLTIYVTRDLSAFLPTVFTPNNDGLNDRFEFDILGAETLNVKVYDRWGGLVYSNDSQPNGITGTNGWDGTRDGKPAAPDTYVYTIDITYFDGNSKQVTGTITLMK